MAEEKNVGQGDKPQPPKIERAGDIKKIVPGREVRVVGTWERSGPDKPACLTLALDGSREKVHFICRDPLLIPTSEASACWTLEIIQEIAKPIGYYYVRVTRAEALPPAKVWGKARRSDKVRTPQTAVARH